MVELYVNFRNNATQYVQNADIIGMNISPPANSTSGSGLQFPGLYDQYDFSKLYPSRYNSMTVSQIKQDLFSHGGTILYEVEAFYNYMFGPYGIFTNISKWWIGLSC